MTLQLGCIADDFTGATDLANNLVQAGLRVWQVMGVPDGPMPQNADAVVVALKSRTAPVADAVRESLDALRWLQEAGARQIYFKYCSTFDSTPQGNIGPVTEALMDALGAGFTVATPAFPDNGRTVFKGYLFVGDVLLHESGMRHHPLTPMTDSNLVRVMQAQSRRKVGLIDHAVVAQGEQAVCDRIAELRRAGVGIAILDAVSNADLVRAGAALRDLPLVTAGSGLAIGLASNFDVPASAGPAACLPDAQGYAAIVSGSCSLASNAQVAAFRQAGWPAFGLDPVRIAEQDDFVQDILSQAIRCLQDGPVLVYATADTVAVDAVQLRYGKARSGEMVEAATAAIALGLVRAGAGRLIVAGGETSGACVQALGIRQMWIGCQIDPGVPWCFAQTAESPYRGIHIALKSGNFGTEDFFEKALRLLD